MAKFNNEIYEELRNKKERRKRQINFLVNSGNALRREIKSLKFNDGDEATITDRFMKLSEIEGKTTEYVRNKHSSTAYSFEPFIGLNRKQRRMR